MRISDWSSDVCSSDLPGRLERFQGGTGQTQRQDPSVGDEEAWSVGEKLAEMPSRPLPRQQPWAIAEPVVGHECDASRTAGTRSEEHTSELQSLMRISYAVFCLKKTKTIKNELISKQSTKTQNERHKT